MSDNRVEDLLVDAAIIAGGAYLGRRHPRFLYGLFLSVGAVLGILFLFAGAKSAFWWCLLLPTSVVAFDAIWRQKPRPFCVSGLDPTGPLKVCGIYIVVGLVLSFIIPAPYKVDPSSSPAWESPAVLASENKSSPQTLRQWGNVRVCRNDYDNSDCHKPALNEPRDELIIEANLDSSMIAPNPDWQSAGMPSLFAAVKDSFGGGWTNVYEGKNNEGINTYGTQQDDGTIRFTGWQTYTPSGYQGEGIDTNIPCDQYVKFTLVSSDNKKLLGGATVYLTC